MASRSSGAGCLVLFGLIFLVAGSIPGFIAFSDLGQAEATGGWRETTAELLHVGLARSDGTARVEARYRYRAPDGEALEGGALRDYEGDQVGIHDGSDNIGGWQEETFARLDAAWRAGSPVPCWYDPADPAQAILDRGERWELVGFMLLFPLIFGLVGGGIMLLGFAQWRRSRAVPADPATAAQRREIPAEGGGSCALWAVAVVWNAISWVAVGALALKDGAPSFIMLMLALFPLIGLGLLWGAALATMRALRHGRPVLRLERGAWLSGSRVQAAVLARTAPQPGDRIAARLRVVRRVVSGSGKNRSTRDEPLWTLDLAVDPHAARREAGLWAFDLDLPLPCDLPPTSDDLSWRLEWQVVRPGPDLSAAFVLPVAAGEEAEGMHAAELAAAADRASPLAVLQRAGVRVGDDGGEVVIAIGAGRNPSLYLTGLGGCAFLSAGAWALWSEVGWWTGLLSLPLLAVCWRGALRSALWRSRIVMGRDRAAVRHGWLAMREAEVALREVHEVVSTSTMSSGETSWHNLWLATVDGVRIPIARGLPGPAAARLRELIDRARR